MISEIFKESLMITASVMVIMLIIEYLNILSRGSWYNSLKKYSFLQVLFAVIIGITPGCIGTYAIVSLYTHNIINLGALVAALSAATGDEAFVMFTLFPKEALKLHIVIFIIAITTGVIVNLIFKNKKFLTSDMELKIHEHEHDHFQCEHKKGILHHFKHISYHRASLIFGIGLFLFFLFNGELYHGHEHNPTQLSDQVDPEASIFKIVFLIFSLAALFIVTIVPDHFLEEHLWQHIIRKHFPKIFFWVIGTLFIIEVGMTYFDLAVWVKTNQFTILLLALLIGIIPQSGPHLIFTTLFFQGAIPFSIILANSIVQDGHGALPLFAESKKSFIFAKSVNILVGLIVGLIGYLIGW